jgi:large subunit ribosomal protein L13
MKTILFRNKDIERKWHLVDASNKTLGRLSSDIALTLTGKKKICYSPHQDLGDYVILINAKKINISGKKSKDKKYHHYSGYPGGLKSINFESRLAKSPEWVIRKAVMGMLPANNTRSKRLERLKIYPDDKHPYEDKLKEN